MAKATTPSAVFSNSPFRHLIMLNALVILVAGATPVLAGRPLATDDAATAGSGNCQIEVWRERSRQVRTSVYASACGISASTELGAEVIHGSVEGASSRVSALSWKWAPEAAPVRFLDTDVKLGFKIASGWTKDPQGNWKQNIADALLLATIPVNDAVAAHLNIGYRRDRTLDSTASLVNFAIAVKASADVELFAETQWNSRRALFGGSIHSVGGRWWAINDKLGIDLTASRTSGDQSASTWSLGFGWYGLRL